MRNQIILLVGLVAAACVVVPSTLSASVIAKIGSKEITTDQVKSEFEGLGSEQKKAINQDAMTRRNLVDNFVNAEVLFQAAVKAGLDKDEDFKMAQEKFKRQYLASRFMKNSVEPKLTKSDIKSFYEKNKSMFDRTEVCAHHIVVEKAEDAKKLTEQAKSKSTNFEDLAKKNSIDPTTQENKGNIGCFSREKMVPEFSEAAFSMRKGEVRGPVQTMYGFHVIKVDDIKPGKIPGFDEVEQKAKESLRIKIVKDMLIDLRNKSNVKVDESELSKFKL